MPSVNQFCSLESSEERGLVLLSSREAPRGCLPPPTNYKFILPGSLGT